MRKSILKANREVAFVRWDYENKPRRAKKIFVNVFKFAILLMCFATVFAVVLAAGVFDTGFDSGANVAEAAASLGDNNIMPETHYSSAFSDNTISGFNNSFHSSSNVIDSSINKDGSVTLELDLSTISFNGYFQGYTGATFDGMDYYVYGNSEEGNYSGSFGVRRNYFAGGTDGVVAVSNIAIPTVIKDLIGGGYTVNINWSGGFYVWDAQAGTIWCGIQGTTSSISGNNVWNNASSSNTTYNWGEHYDARGDSADYTYVGNFISGSDALSSADNYIAIYFYREPSGAAQWGGCATNVK